MILMKTTMIHARIDPKTKDHVETIFRQLGMTTTQAIRLFYQQVVIRNGMPFDINVPNQVTQKAIEASRLGHLETFDFDHM